LRLNIIQAAFQLNRQRRAGGLVFSGNADTALQVKSDALEAGAVPTGELGEKTIQGVRTKKGVAASAGLQAIMSGNKDNPVTSDCVNAAIIAIHEGYRRLVGDKQYDAQFPRGLVLGGANGAALFFRPAPLPGLMIPGDAVIFQVVGAKKRAYLFENTIYLGKSAGGDNLFFAFPFGITTQDSLEQQLVTKSGGTKIGSTSIRSVQMPTP
jgi:hypothetical protein